MHFNIYIDDKTGALLSHLAKKQKITRNALIRTALQEWATQHTEKPKWPEIVMAFKGLKSFKPLESHRHKLQPPKKDPFA